MPEPVGVASFVAYGGFLVIEAARAKEEGTAERRIPIVVDQDERDDQMRWLCFLNYERA